MPDEYLTTNQSHIVVPDVNATFTSPDHTPPTIVPRQIASPGIANLVQIPKATTAQVLPATSAPRAVSVCNIGQTRVYIVPATGAAPNGRPIAINDEWSITTDQAVYLSVDNAVYGGTVIVIG